MDWYDSLWLSRYFAAKEIFRRVAPSRLAEFENSMSVFRTDDSFQEKYVSGLLDAAALQEIRETVAAIPQAAIELHEMRRFGRLVVHDWPPFTIMQEKLAGFVSQLAGEEVEPRYNFLSLYSRYGVCETHLDTPSAKWTLDVCIDQSEPWPISFSSVIPWPTNREELVEDWRSVVESRSKHEIRSLALQPGDALLFSGASQWHFREPIPNTGRKAFCDLLFFHYIPKGTLELVQPANWAGIFDVPELNTIPDIERQL